MLSEIELSYVEQGYRLPPGLSWADVARHRARWTIDPLFVPLAVASGCIGWGVPFAGGEPLRHP